MPKDSAELLGRVSNLKQDDSSRDIYDDWSQDYDEHLKSELGYIAPGVAVAELVQHLQQRDLEIIDFGCGTGLVGEALHEQGFVHVDGADISSGMLVQAWLQSHSIASFSPGSCRAWCGQSHRSRSRIDDVRRRASSRRERPYGR